MTESMHYDVLIVGAGPAGLSTAIELKKLAADKPLTIAVLEKSAALGGHILSGCVFEPRALNELLPDWQKRGAPLHQPVTGDEFWLLSKKHGLRLPTPPAMRNHGNYIISLSNFTAWLGEQAQAMGVDIFPGFAGAELLFDSGRVSGIRTGAMGLLADGTPGPQYQPGMDILCQQLILAEGAHGSLSQEIIARYHLRRGRSPQTYGLGIKELWQIDAAQSRPGLVWHSVGWPLSRDVYGGSFLYYLPENQVMAGFVVGLDYQNPYLSPFQEFQQWKTHPKIQAVLQGGKRLAYGARALTEGGFQSMPKLSFQGGVLVGCAAGLMNVPKIKGTHTAMYSGMLAARAMWPQLCGENPRAEITGYEPALRQSWAGRELWLVRNIRPGFHFGLWAGLAYAAFDTYVLRGRAPWTLHHRADHAQTAAKINFRPIAYPKPDGVVSFDLLSSVYLSNTNHREHQPKHLQLRDAARAIAVNYHIYDSPETRYCPAGVYEIVYADNRPELQINAQNCVHCKTCDIKDPTQNIRWVPPEGGGGPDYRNL
jgi:electron-transferring-flavoprotein dehydrogenase